MNNGEDRNYGDLVEQEFEWQALMHGRAAQRHQVGRTTAARIKLPNEEFVIAPDLMLWSLDAGNSLHEVKGKYPTSSKCFGLEEYRLESLIKLLPFQEIFYVIRVGLRSDFGIPESFFSKFRNENLIKNACPEWRGVWVWARVSELAAHVAEKREGPTYINGRRERAEICYWPVSRWRPVDFGNHITDGDDGWDCHICGLRKGYDGVWRIETTKYHPYFQKQQNRWWQ